MKTLAAVFAIAVAASVTASAQMQHYLNYQGRLVNDTNLVNADVQLVLRLYDDETKGTLLCEDSNSAVRVVDGLYSTIIGDDLTTGSLANLMFEAPWLEVEVNGTQFAPREQVVPVLYALNALDAQVAGTAGYATSAGLAAYATTASNVVPSCINSASISNGTVGIVDLERPRSMAIVQAHIDEVGAGQSDAEFFELTMPDNAMLDGVQVYAIEVTGTVTVDVKESGTSVLASSVSAVAGSAVNGSIYDATLGGGNALTVHVTTAAGADVQGLTVTIVLHFTHVW